MKKVLVVDTSSNLGGVSLLNWDERSLSSPSSHLLDHEEWIGQASHSETATVAVKKILKRQQLQLKNISLYAVNIGPGSFTGIRVGINLVKALAYSFQVPIASYSSLKALALSQPSSIHHWPIVCLVNAHKNMVYAAKYEWTSSFGAAELLETVSPCALKIEEVDFLFSHPTVVVGDGHEIFSPYFSKKVKRQIIRDPHTFDQPQIQKFSSLLSWTNEHEFTNDWKSVKALYIRSSEAEEKLKKGLLKPLPKL